MFDVRKSFAFAFAGVTGKLNTNMRIQKEKTIIILNLGNVWCNFYVVTKHL